MSINSNLIEKIGFGNNQEWYLSNTRQINFFIGPNNSGKSRELRQLFSINENTRIFGYRGFLVEDLAKDIVASLEATGNYRNIAAKYAIDIKRLKHSIRRNITNAKDTIEYLRLVYRDTGTRYQNKIDEFVQSIIEEYFLRTSTDAEQIDILINQSWQKMYIPTLRSLRNVDDKDIYRNRTAQDYFQNDASNIFTGHSIYKELVDHLLGTHAQRTKIREYELYLSKNFFFGEEISIVPRVDGDVVHFKQGKSEERPIYDLGDGIQSLILLTFSVFMAEKPTMFFIEEPEHYLHAGLQRTLIETFAKKKQHMFFMTTHSNHFLDIAQERDDISIHQISRTNEKTTVEPAREYGTLLTELGVRASSVLLANCSIWVEGITDKLYLRTYLNKYIEELRENGETDKANRLSSYHENLHYVFAEYQGSNITHWAFDDEGSESQTPAKKLNSNIFLIADADIDGKGSRVQYLADALGQGFYLLEWKEIENYIPHRILIETARRRWETFNQRSECSIKRFANIEQDRFEKVDQGVGGILERFVDKKKGLERDFYKDKSGTIKDKVKFCQTAIKTMEDQEWKLTPPLNELCEAIWVHIEANN
ncbi:AAA family ATPase [Vibrio coralliilyticus]|uniref:ATP-binding protein n=1 Tax=Vibrio coralliilyticus TaxID=190893 RepID=A0AAP6ZNQ3_9VIBR|nr:ATP-binding protein [Vibrio coralliilyticus]NOJ22198.1 ATP-binding protein [Vibrio coralliilyticus]